jgi:hypothetical protein
MVIVPPGVSRTATGGGIAPTKELAVHVGEAQEAGR